MHIELMNKNILWRSLQKPPSIYCHNQHCLLLGLERASAVIFSTNLPDFYTGLGPSQTSRPMTMGVSALRQRT